MALASRFSDRAEFRTRPEDPNTAGELFATQAKTMLHFEYEAPTTSTVQAAALLGLYWAAIDRESLGFMYIGMASRMAMNLGLHSDCSSYVEQGIISEADAEVRNTAFWGVYVLDKYEIRFRSGQNRSFHSANHCIQAVLSWYGKTCWDSREQYYHKKTEDQH